jgi:hypothetical protein
VRGNVAKGFILRDDLTLAPTVVVKRGDKFAHGETLELARMALTEKLQAYPEYQLEELKAAFESGPISGAELSEWHSKVTGSCQQGRDEFIRAKGIDLKRKYDAKEFLVLVKGQYGYEHLEGLIEP